MQLSDSFWEMTERFVNYIHTETGFNIIVCDEKGIIKKAYVKERIGQSHAGAQKILSTSINEIAITEEDERRNPLTKEGLNYAIVIDGEKPATFGIAGKLSAVTPIMKLASMILVGWVNRLRQQDMLQAMYATLTSPEITPSLLFFLTSSANFLPDLTEPGFLPSR